MNACTRVCALGPLGKLDAASLLAQHLRARVRACVRIKRTPSIPDTPYLSLGWANKSGAGILRSHNLHNSAVIRLLATPFVSKPCSYIMDSYGFGGQECNRNKREN